MEKKKSNISEQNKENLGKVIDYLSEKFKVTKTELMNIDKTNELIDKTKNRLKELDELYEENKKCCLEEITHNILNNIEKSLNLTLSRKEYNNTIKEIKESEKLLSDLREAIKKNLYLNLELNKAQDPNLLNKAEANKKTINDIGIRALKDTREHINQKNTLLAELKNKITSLENELEEANKKVKKNERGLFNHIFNIIKKLTKDINQGVIKIDVTELVNSLQNTQGEKVKSYIKNYLSDKDDLKQITDSKKEKLERIQKLKVLKEYLSNSKETQSEKIKLPDENFGEMKNKLLNKLPEKLRKGLNLNNQLEIKARIIKYKGELNAILPNTINELEKEKEDLISKNNKFNEDLNDIAIKIKDILLSINPIRNRDLNEDEYSKLQDEFQILKNKYKELDKEKLEIESRISEIDNTIKEHNTKKDDLKDKITILESLLDLVNNHKSVDKTGNKITIATQTEIVFDNKIAPDLYNS